MAKTSNRTTLVTLLGGLFACIVLLPAVAQDTPVIKIARLKGTVEAAHAEETSREWVAASVGQELTEGWRLRTGADSKVQLVFPRDNVVILKENSVLYVDQLDLGGGANLEADQGSLLVQLANALAPGSDFELETPTALAVVRGTTYGADNIGDYGVTFYGYHGQVEIFDSGQMFEPVLLTAGQAVDVFAGEAPSQPYGAGDAGADFLNAALDPTGYEATTIALMPLHAKLQQLHIRLNQLDEELATYEAEWARYDSKDQVPEQLLLYLQVLRLRERLDDLADEYADLVEPAAEPAGLGGLFADLSAALAEREIGVDQEGAAFRDVVDAVDEHFDGGPGPEDIGLALAAVAHQFSDLYFRLYEFEFAAEPLVTDNQELVDELASAIDTGDPALGLRWGVFDTDNDGVNDADELVIGSDPLVDNEAEGFIELIAPDDGDEVDYPADEAITFEFEPLDSDAVTGYDLLVEANGQQWLRQGVDPSEDVDLDLLVGNGGAFAEQASGAAALTVSWQVIARLDASAAASGPYHTSRQAALSVLNVTSLTRELTINLPEPADVVVVNLEEAGSATVAPEETVTVRGTIEGAANLGSWEITIVYDPSVLVFESGRRLGLFGDTTLFFGDQLGGVLTISGSVPAGADTGVTGDGDIFELEFFANTVGSSTVEIDALNLTGFFGADIDAEIGTSVDIDVY
ncbi:FecR domain-containing protein [bacterium]|nr:FecR domain-containing protein [bacterium]